MTVSHSVQLSITTIFLLVMVLFLANLPFLTRRTLWRFWVAVDKVKPIYQHGLELLLFYLVSAILAYILESGRGAVYAQNWEFYAVTVLLFIVMGYPGFVYRYLWKRGLE